MSARAAFLLLPVLACTASEPIELDPTGGTTATDPDPTLPSTTVPTDPGTTTAGGCVPTRDAFEANALPAIEANCTTCHGATPQFGAPYSLLDYDALVAGTEPDRIVDKMVLALTDGAMPPATQPDLSHNDLDTLVGWASCGLVHPDPGDGLVANRDVWQAPVDPPAGATAVNLSANGHYVGPNDIDDYQYFTFRNLVDHDMFIRRIEAVIDESRVVHHITLNHLIGYDYLYTWAPGTGAIEFPDGGIRLSPNETLVMNIHYNNGAGIPDVYDSSGLRLWVDEPVGTEWGMASPAVYNIDVPPGQVAPATDTCRATRDYEILAAMPHMHEIGSEFHHTIERSDGTVESLIDLTGWSFEAQYFYEMPVTVHSGDLLTLTCVFDNPGSQTVHFGEGTSDEMCFDFMYVTPPEAAFQCFL
ncbi:MAG: hypothetical protein R3F59_17390 [Myxococcota bacterium]